MPASKPHCHLRGTLPVAWSHLGAKVAAARWPVTRAVGCPFQDKKKHHQSLFQSVTGEGKQGGHSDTALPYSSDVLSYPFSEFGCFRITALWYYQRNLIVVLLKHSPILSRDPGKSQRGGEEFLSADRHIFAEAADRLSTKHPEPSQYSQSAFLPPAEFP